MMENIEQEDSNTDIKEKVPVSGKKHVFLQWKSQKDQERKKKDDDEQENIAVESSFENEAKKMCKNYSQYTQRKEQERTKVSSTAYSKTNKSNPIVKVRRINVKPCNPVDDANDQIWNDCDDDYNIPRPAVASINLTKNTNTKVERKKRLHRSKGLKRNRPTRPSRAKSNKRYEEYFLDESESEDDGIEEEEEFNLTKELSMSCAKQFKRWQKRINENDKTNQAQEDEQPESDIAKWVFDVLSISNVKNSHPVCAPKVATNPPLPEKKNSDDQLKLITSLITEETFLEYALDGPDQESKPFTGSAAQIPAPNVIETLPNMVPRKEHEDRPIKHSHCITNEPINDNEEEVEPEGIMGITTRLLGKAMKTSCKNTDVKPFRCVEPFKSDMKDEYRDEAPDRWQNEPISDYDFALAAMRI